MTKPQLEATLGNPLRLLADEWQPPASLPEKVRDSLRQSRAQARARGAASSFGLDTFDVDGYKFSVRFEMGPDAKLEAVRLDYKDRDLPIGMAFLHVAQQLELKYGKGDVENPKTLGDFEELKRREFQEAWTWYVGTTKILLNYRTSTGQLPAALRVTYSTSKVKISPTI
jgi:hypothetical protein